MNTYVLSFVLLTSCLASPARASSQTGDFQFEHITLEQGVSNTLVWCIYQDRAGFLWYGTMYGLIKYDGYDFTTYRHDPADSTTLSNEDIISICEDRKGNLWIGSYGGGLNKLDRRTGRFTRYIHNNSDSTSISDDMVWVILEDSEGFIWVGTGNGGLNRFDPEKNIFAKYVRTKGDNASITGGGVISLCEDKNGTLWIGTHNGLNKFNRASNSFTRFKHDPTNAKTIGGNAVSAILQDRNGMLWIGTDNGVNQFSPQTGECVLRPGQQRKNANSLVGQSINRIIEDKDGMLWFATMSGLSRFNPSTATFTNFTADSAGGLSSNNVTGLFQDRSGIIWIGTYQGGLDKLILGKKKFSHVSIEPKTKSSMYDVFAIHEDRFGIIWIGTKEGLFALDSTYTLMSQFTSDQNSKNGLCGDLVTSVCEDSSGTLWVGTRSGLCKFNRRSQSFAHLINNPNDSTTISANEVTKLLVDRKGTLWVGTSFGLNRFDAMKNRFTRFNSTQGDSTTLPNDCILTLFEDSFGTLWVGTYGGLSKFNRQTNRVTTFAHHLTDVQTLSNNYVLSIGEDLKRRLWIGTGGGLNLCNRASGTFTSYNERDGLPNGVIKGIIEERDGILWLSTNRGLSRFDAEKKQCKNYDRLDGLQSNMFHAGSYVKRRNGELMFGGINGFTVFRPESLNANPFVPPIAITAFMLFDDSRTFQQDFSYADNLTVSYKQNFFALSFAALDFTRPEQNEYAYMLKGFDDDWIRARRNRFARYTNLEPGEYVFRVKGSNNDGIWNEEGVSLRITIAPPFWKTSWFRILAAVATFALAFATYKWRVRSRLRQLLAIEHARRQEAELVRKKAANDFHDELGHRLTKIGLFTAIVKRRLSNASPDIMKYLDKISDDSQNLTSDTRDFIWTLDPDKDSLFDVAIHLKDFGEELFDRTGIAFTTKGISEDLLGTKLSMETRRHLTLIFKEGMNNILKHAAAGNVSLSVEFQNGNLRLALTDDGKGYDNNSGAGYGLKNMQQRAEKIHSAIRFDSEPGRGSTIELMVKAV